MTTRKIRILRALLHSGVALWTILLTPLLLQAAPDVAARYAISSGTQLVIDITTGSNPPASLILVQRFPHGVRMLSSSPGASNYNPQGNTAKWLLRSPGPGRSTVSMTLDRAVSAHEISAEILYKPAQGGGTTTVSVAK